MTFENYNRQRPQLKILSSALALSSVGIAISVLVWLLFTSLGVAPTQRASATITSVGAAGGAIVLAISFRKQAAIEATQAQDGISHAVQMLAQSQEITTRLAGISALVEIADRFGSKHVQQIVDIICGYLRSPRTNDEVVEITILKLLNERFVNTSCLFDEYEPRTITRMLSKIGIRSRAPSGVIHADGQQSRSKLFVAKLLYVERFRKRGVRLWSECSIDLRGAIFQTEFGLENVRSFEAVFLDKAVFIDGLRINGCEFGGHVSLMGATSCAHSEISGSYFSRGINLDNSEFRDSLRLETVGVGDDFNCRGMTVRRSFRVDGLSLMSEPAVQRFLDQTQKFQTTPGTYAAVRPDAESWLSSPGAV